MLFSPLEHFYNAKTRCRSFVVRNYMIALRTSLPHYYISSAEAGSVSVYFNRGHL